VAKQNAAFNKVGNSIIVKQIDLRKEVPPTRTDVLMANLHHKLLAALFRNHSFWQAGMYILSGFMPGEEEQLLASLPSPPPSFLERRRQEKWCVWVLGNN
jgi:ribosomal protein L11 methylase PrmA